MKIRKKRQLNNRGIALLSVLFVIMAVVVISTGFIHRSDMSLACGQNLNYRTAADYMAWSGLEHARAYIISESGDDEDDLVDTWLLSNYQIETDSPCSYTVCINSRTKLAKDDDDDPDQYIYDVKAKGFYKHNSDTKGRSIYKATILFIPSIDTATFLEVHRP